MYKQNKHILAIISIVSVYTIVYTYFHTNIIHAYGGIDTAIQTALDTLRPKDTIDELYGAMKFGNIYSNAYKLVATQEKATIIQTYAKLKEEINTQYACELSDHEVEALFANGGQTVSAKDCLPLLNCREGKKNTRGNNYKQQVNLYSNGVGNENGVSQTQYANCKGYVTTKYTQTHKAIANTTSLINTTLGNDIYANGTLEDGGYDILYDIQMIGEILFANNERTAKTLFFTFPKGSIAGLQAIPFGETTTSTVTPDGRISQSNTNNTNGSNSDSTYSNTANNNTALSPTTPTLNSPTNTKIANYVCTTNGSNSDSTYSNTVNNNSSNTTPNNNTSNTNTTEDRNEIVDITKNGSIQENTTNPSVENANWEDSASMTNNEAQVTSCIKKCTNSNLKATDKALCIAKCTCMTHRTDNGMAGISVCMIPTKQADVMSNKPIQSIQEVITEINNVLIALRNSGQLIKHNRTTEFLDTSLAKIQFNKILAVDINLATKPIFPVTPKKKDIAKQDTESDRMAIGSYTNIDIGKEKNKYAYYRNRSDNKIDDTLGTTSTSWNDNMSSLGKVTSESLSKTHNAQIADAVRIFIQDNISFRDSLADTIASIQKTADQIKQKIMKK